MKKNISLSIVIFLSILILPVSNYATEGLSADNGEELKLYVGCSQIIPVKNPTRVEVVNPNIADVINVTNDELTISPKAAGRTSLRFWDIFGEQKYQIKVFNENIQEIKQRIDNMLKNLNFPQVYTQAQEDEGKVLLLGSVQNPQDRERISLVLNNLKDKIVDLIAVKEDQTAIEIAVEVLELDKDATKTLGFTNPLSSTVSLTEVGSPGILDAGTYWTKLFRVVDMKRGAFNWTLSALVKEGKARILSRPRLACQSGKEAELLVGGEKPIFTTEVASAGGQGTSVEYKEYGLKLKIKPIVSEGNRIKVVLNVDISEVGAIDSIGETSTGSTTAKAFPLTKRSVSTELYLNNGQTLAIGGLIRHKQEEEIEKTPGLGDIPVLGFLFRKKTSKVGGGTGERGDTELFITLTPNIIANLESAAQSLKQEPANQEVIVNTNAAPLTARPEVNKSAELKDYTAGIQRKIMSQLSYPVNARKAGYQGTVKLGLLLSSQGRLKETIVKDSSGYKDLDDIAVEVAKLVIPYPPFPSSFDQEEIWVDIPISYQLN